jgi:hypothetical protein
MSIIDQILRQRALIIRMDQHYQKQLDFLHMRIAKLEEQTGQSARNGPRDDDDPTTPPPVRPLGPVPQPRTNALRKLAPLPQPP